MAPVYKVIDWEFNKGAWARTMQECIDMVGSPFMAQIMGVVEKTIINWAKMPDSAYGEFPYPNMTNFIKFCNEFDKDPRDFFILKEI